MKIIFSFVLAAILIGSAASAQVDSGVPDGSGTLGIANDQFLAQEFTLAAPLHVTRIEVYMTQSIDPIDVHLMTAIGPGTTVADEITSFSLSAPANNVYVGEDVDLNLAADTYYLVLSTAGLTGGGAPFKAPNFIGHSFVVNNAGSLNASYAPASDWTQLSGETTYLGIRIIPEPATFGLIAMSVGSLLCVCRRKRSA